MLVSAAVLGDRSTLNLQVGIRGDLGPRVGFRVLGFRV